jgi:hypothetical protein
MDDALIERAIDLLNRLSQSEANDPLGMVSDTAYDALRDFPDQQLLLDLAREGEYSHELSCAEIDHGVEFAITVAGWVVSWRQQHRRRRSGRNTLAEAAPGPGGRAARDCGSAATPR